MSVSNSPAGAADAADSPSLDALSAQLGSLATEAIDEDLQDLDLLPTPELVSAMYARSRVSVDAVEEVLPEVMRAVDAISERMGRGGRLIYVGAGTSGRLGVLDASECPPTFGTDPGLVVGLIAGGDTALRNAVEGAEDDATQGARDLVAIGISASDTVVGLAASGRTPYVLGALGEAKRVGGLAVSVACNRPSRMAALADIAIDIEVGPEFIAGSTRLGAGTAQKLVLNMLSTLTMVRLGKTYGNVMVDLQATNAKLVVRSRRTVAAVTGVDERTAADALSAADGSVKVAVLTLLAGVSPSDAAATLHATDGHLRDALRESGPPQNRQR